MNAVRALYFMEQYNKCPNCGNEKVGNEKVGNGKGSIIVENDTFIRHCECGYHLVIKETGVKGA